VALLLLNQLGINLGFYMLMPYLAAHLSGELGLATWVVGLVLGVRNLSQQGMFLLGGSLADRFGYKPLIIAGCALRTAGFVLLGLVDSLPALIVASAATGFAGALFNPAVRAYLARDAGDRRLEAFSLFNVFYQGRILLGPLIGLALTGIAFQLTALAAAAVFAALTVLQLRALPACSPQHDPTPDPPSARVGWRVVCGNRPFLLFSLAMIGFYVLSFQVYLALPLQTRHMVSSELAATVAVGMLFAVSGLLAVAGQVRITAWCAQRWNRGQSLTVGLALMAAAFLIPLATSTAHPSGSIRGAALAMTPLVLSAALLTLGTLVVYPVEMDTIVSLSGDRFVATHYGLYNTLCGIGITAGNLLTGTAFDLARSAGWPALPWLVLAALGTGCALAVHVLARRGHLDPIASTTTSEHTVITPVAACLKREV
jgi:MFS family permease